MNAPWKPLWTVLTSAKSATAVFPEPTSPWISLRIGNLLSISFETARKTFFWSPVSSKGNFLSADLTNSPFFLWLIPNRSSWVCFFINISPHWIKNSSSKAKRRLAWSSSIKSFGKWTARIALSSEISCWACKISCGRISLSVGIEFRRFFIAVRKTFWDMAAVEG